MRVFCLEASRLPREAPASIELRRQQILIRVLRFPFLRTDEPDALTPRVGIENPRELPQIPQGGLLAIDIAIAFHHRAGQAPLRDRAEDLFVAVRCAPGYHAALAGIAQPRGTERASPSQNFQSGAHGFQFLLNQNRKVCAPGESGRSILLFAVIDIQHLLFVGVSWIS